MQPFESELAAVADLQAAAVAAQPGEPLLDALGALECALATLQRPARYFADFASDARQAAAAAALLGVCRGAARDAYAAPRVVAALLATASRLLPDERARCGLALRLDAVTRQQGRGGSGGGNGGERAAAVAALAEAAAALDDALYAVDPRCNDSGDGGGQRRQLQLMMACRQALRAAAAAISHQEADGAGEGGGGGAAHPYDERGGGGGGGGGGGAPSGAGVADAALRPRGTTSTDSDDSGSSAAAVEVDMAATAFALVAADRRLSPVLLLTREQAAIVRPLLHDAGVPDESCWLTPGGGGDDSASGLRLRCSLRLRIAPGRAEGSRLELTNLVTATEAAEAWLAEAAAGAGGGGGGAPGAIPERGVLRVPAGAPLAALTVTRDVLSLLLQQHPNADVRRQLHASGLLQRRRLLLRALSPLARARARLAAERGARSHLDLLLGEGSPLRAPAAVEALLARLARGVEAYARADAADLEAMAARRSRAAGSGGYGGGYANDGGGGGRLAPWDVDYCMQAAAVVRRCFCPAANIPLSCPVSSCFSSLAHS